MQGRSHFKSMEEGIPIMKPGYHRVLQFVLAIVLFAGAGTFNLGTAHAEISRAFWLKNLITLPYADYDVAEADKMVDRLLKINPSILESLVYEGVEIRLVNGPITNEPEYAYLKGVTPRGWESTGLTWDDVPGAGGNPTIIRIGYSEKGNGHGAYNLELHETFHAIDSYVFNDISQGRPFYSIFLKEADNLFAGNQYQEVYPEEYFAEVAAMYLLNDTTRNLLKSKAPETYAFIQNLFANHTAMPESIYELDGHWAQKDLERLYSLRILSGFSDGTIRPDANVSREQFAKLLIEALGVSFAGTGSAVFRDVPLDSWSAPYILTAVNSGIIDPKEYAGGRFEPAKPLTRAEMATWVARAMQLTPDESALRFADSNAIVNHRGWIGASVKTGIISGMPNNLFVPDGLVTRAQAAAVLNRMLNH
jgi:hypothetical protein